MECKHLVGSIQRMTGVCGFRDITRHLADAFDELSSDQRNKDLLRNIVRGNDDDGDDGVSRCFYGAFLQTVFVVVWVAIASLSRKALKKRPESTRAREPTENGLAAYLGKCTVEDLAAICSETVYNVVPTPDDAEALARLDVANKDVVTRGLVLMAFILGHPRYRQAMLSMLERAA